MEKNSMEQIITELKRLEKGLKEDIKDLEKRIEKRIDDLEKRLCNVENRLKDVDDKLDRVERDLRRLRWRVEDLEDEMDSLRRRFRRGIDNYYDDLEMPKVIEPTPALGGIMGCEWDESGESLD